MKLIVGLGNPGDEYRNSRHNVGFMAVDAMKAQSSKLKSPHYAEASRGRQNDNSKFQMNNKFNAEVCKIDDVVLIKPQTYMNRSGEAVRRVKDYYDIELEDVWVIHDDLDIELGKYKIQLGKGPKRHNGVESVEQGLGEKDFWRVRIGVENRKQQATSNKLQDANKLQISNNNETKAHIPGEKYVLGNFSKDEREVVDEVMREVVGEMIKRIGIGK